MTTHTNYRAFLIHALFLSLSMSFIDVNTVAPAMLTQSGGSTFHLGLLSAIMVGMASFMQLFFATLIMGFRRKKTALLVGIYIRVTSLFILAFFLKNLGLPATWKIYFILSLMALFSFSGAFANIAYTDILGSTIAKPMRKRLLTHKQLISSIGLIISSLIVRVVLSRFSFPESYSLLFFAASALLLLATIGFWMLKEEAKENSTTYLERLSLLALLLKQDKNIRMYLLLINTSGIILATLPFLVVLANTYAPVDGSSTGSYLLMQLFGSLLMTLLTKKFSKTERYRSLLYIFIFLASSIPLVALLLRHHQHLYLWVFVLAGASTALYHILSVGI
ncbi:MAG: MFS transporter, partial [Spirochaetia bacterium]|nr:MFS transporter [Spirochaetia bacterium]